jgi:hypothetical protein
MAFSRYVLLGKREEGKRGKKEGREGERELMSLPHFISFYKGINSIMRALSS